MHNSTTYSIFFRMRHASLFTGIGGFDYAAAQFGWENVFQVEKDAWCNQLLALRFPNTERYFDIKEFSGEKYRGIIDVISGGFPCQPFSVAGKKLGKEDDRYLWKEMLRVIAEIRPTWVIGENVAGIIKLALDEVLLDLENCGYATETFIIPACSVGAPHRRDRVWIVAYTGSQRTGSESRKIGDEGWISGRNRSESIRQGYGEISASGITSTSRYATHATSERVLRGSAEIYDQDAETQEWNDNAQSDDANQSLTPDTKSIISNRREYGDNSSERELLMQIRGSDCISSDTTSIGLEATGEFERQLCSESDRERQTSNAFDEFSCDTNGIGREGIRAEFNNEGSIRLPTGENSGWRTLEWPTQPPLCGGNDGISNRVDRLRALGNSIVPQVAMQIFNAINTIHNAQ